MQNLVPVIRNAVRALIIRDDRILLLRKEGGERGERFALPGGAQDLGETLEQALNRECMEEIATEVSIQHLVQVADYFKQRDTSPPSTRHLVEFLFECTIPESYQPKSGHHPDKHQVEVVWTALDDLENISFYPRSFASHLKALRSGDTRVYLGTID